MREGELPGKKNKKKSGVRVKKALITRVFLGSFWWSFVVGRFVYWTVGGSTSAVRAERAMDMRVFAWMGRCLTFHEKNSGEEQTDRGGRKGEGEKGGREMAGKRLEGERSPIGSGYIDVYDGSNGLVDGLITQFVFDRWRWLRRGRQCCYLRRRVMRHCEIGECVVVVGDL